MVGRFNDIGRTFPKAQMEKNMPRFSIIRIARFLESMAAEFFTWQMGAYTGKY